MTRRFRLSLLAALALGAATLLSPSATAQDAAKGDLAYRMDLVERMGKDRKARLKRALVRFKSLPEARRKELRKKVQKIGEDRLLGLDGRDPATLRKKHEKMRERHQALLDLVGKPRLANLSQDETAYVHAMARRRFHAYFKNSMLKLAGPWQREEWKNLSEDERRQKAREARQRVEEHVLKDLSEAERTEFDTLKGRERHARMREFMQAEMDRYAMDFAPVFESAFLDPFLRSPPEERARQVQRFKQKQHWYEVRRVLFREMSKDTRRQLFHLRPDQLAEVRTLWEQTKDLPAAERRTQIEVEVRRLYSEASIRRKAPRRGSERGPDRRKRRRDGDAQDGGDPDARDQDPGGGRRR